jgi:hypothetical protein
MAFIAISQQSSATSRSRSDQARGEHGDSRSADAPCTEVTMFRHLVASRTEAGSRRTCGGFAADEGSDPDPTADPTPDPTTQTTAYGAAGQTALAGRDLAPESSAMK